MDKDVEVNADDETITEQWFGFVDSYQHALLQAHNAWIDENAQAFNSQQMPVNVLSHGLAGVAATVLTVSLLETNQVPNRKVILREWTQLVRKLVAELLTK